MDFVTGLPISINWKGEIYDSILVIVNRLTKIVYYKLVKVTINELALAEVIIVTVVRHYDLPNSIVSDWGLVFTSKFWSSLYYFLRIKQRLSTAFYLQTDGQTKRQNSTIKAHLRTFVNLAQDDWARFLYMAEFTYNNTQNASTGYRPFELNCSYHPEISYKEDINLRFQSKSVDELATELRELIATCKKNL